MKRIILLLAFTFVSFGYSSQAHAIGVGLFGDLTDGTSFGSTFGGGFRFNALGFNVDFGYYNAKRDGLSERLKNRYIKAGWRLTPIDTGVSVWGQASLSANFLQVEYTDSATGKQTGNSTNVGGHLAVGASVPLFLLVRLFGEIEYGKVIGVWGYDLMAYRLGLMLEL